MSILGRLQSALFNSSFNNGDSGDSCKWGEEPCYVSVTETKALKHEYRPPKLLGWIEANRDEERSSVLYARRALLVSGKACNWSIKDAIMIKNKTQPTFYELNKHQSTITKIWQFLGQNRYGNFTRPFQRVHLKPGEGSGTRLWWLHNCLPSVSGECSIRVAVLLEQLSILKIMQNKCIIIENAHFGKIYKDYNCIH